MKTTTDIITGHTASAVHGIGADITVRTGVHITVRTGVPGVTVRGDITDFMTHGTTTRGDMPDTGDGMTHGTMEVIGAECGEAIGAGMTHGTITITTAAGTTHIITITTITEGLHTSEEAPAAVKTYTTAFVHGLNPTGRSHRATAHHPSRQVRSEHPAERSEAA